MTESTSSDDEDRAPRARHRELARRGQQRRQRFLLLMRRLEGSSQTLLEERCVTPLTMQRYRESIKKFEKWCIASKTAINEVELLDAALALFFQEQFLEGQHAHVGEYLLAAVLALRPGCGRRAGAPLPRAARALKGWRRLARRPLRRTLSFPAVAALACRLAARDPLKAAWTMLSFVNYYRPSENLGLLRKDLIPPVFGVSQHWSVLTFPNERQKVSKTDQVDVSILVDHPRFPFMDKMLTELKRGEPAERVWPFDYHGLLAAFHVAGKELEMPWVTPYLLRHAGPSWDMLTGARPMLEIQRRGQWKAVSSMAKYEKHARVGADELGFSAEMRRHFRECAFALEEVLLGRVPPPLPPR